MGLADFAGRLFGRRPADTMSAALPSSGRRQAVLRDDERGDAAAVADQEPKFQSWTQWTVPLVESALVMADSGDLSRVAELCDAVLADERIPGLWETRTDAITGAPVTFEAAGDGRRRGRAKRALEADEDFWVACPEPELAALLRWGRFCGVGFARLLQVEHDGRVVPSLKVWHPRWFKYDYDIRSWTVQTELSGPYKPIRAGDGEWVIFTPFGESRPWANGTWRSLSLLQVSKRDDWKDWARFNEAHGQPAWVIEGEKVEARRARLAAAFGNLNRNPAVALPPLVTAKLVEAVSGNWESFQAKIRAIDTAASIAILGGNLLSEVSGSQQTGATGQKDNQKSKARSDATALATCIHDQQLVWWAEYNFGDPNIAPWPTWHTEPISALSWKQAGDALFSLRKAGFKVKPEVVLATFGIPVEAAEPLPDSAVGATGKAEDKPADEGDGSDKTDDEDEEDDSNE